jgi:hypothetical protein
VITVLNEQVKVLQGQVGEHFGRHPDAEACLSQPGMGKVSAPGSSASPTTHPGCHRDGKARRNYAATGPLTRAPGKKKVVTARLIHNERLAGALNASPGARAYHDEPPRPQDRT